MQFLKTDSAWEDCRIFITEDFLKQVGPATVSNDADIILPQGYRDGLDDLLKPLPAPFSIIIYF